MKHYDNLRNVPEDALKKIDFGALKGKLDINPQWRWEALTKEFGACGEGWKYEVAETLTQDIPATGEVMLFMRVNLYFKTGESWSAAIPGFGGDYLVIKDKNGIHGNDEAYKMALTDALGAAAKMIGLAADVYRGFYDTKYKRQETPPSKAVPDKAKDGGKAAKEAPPREDRKAPDWITMKSGAVVRLDSLPDSALLKIAASSDTDAGIFRDKANAILNAREAAS